MQSMQVSFPLHTPHLSKAPATAVTGLLLQSCLST